MSSNDIVSRLRPYVAEAVDNDYARENLLAGVTKLRDAIERSRRRRVKPTEDKRLRAQMKAAADSISEGARALASGRTKPPRRWPRRLVVLLGIAGVAGAAAWVASNRSTSAEGV